MILINGEEVRDFDQKLLSEYLDFKSYNCSRVAVEINRRIVPKKEYDKTILHDRDEVEIVHFVGGG